MKIRLSESNFRYMLSEMVKTVLLEAKLDPFYERVIHQYLSRFGGIRGTLPNCSREEFIQYVNQGLTRAYHWAHNKYVMNIQQFIRKIQRNFLNCIILNDKGLIYVERQMKFANNINFNRLTYKSVGECWSWKPGNAKAYCDSRTYDVNTIVLHGYVHPKDVDWIETLYINVYSMSHETELRMSDNAKVELTDITVNGKKIALPETILVKADANKYRHDYNDEYKYPNLDKFRRDHFQDQEYSIDDNYTQEENILDLCEIIKKITDNLFIIKYDTYYNIYDESNNSVVVGDIDNPATWFDWVDNFEDNGIAVVRLNDKYNWFSLEKQELLSPNKWFDWVDNFDDNGIAEVGLNDKINIFSLEKQELLSPNKWFDWVSKFDSKGIAEVKLNGKFNWISLEKQGVLSPNLWFDRVGDFYDGIAKVGLNDKYNWFSLEKQELLSPNLWFGSVGDKFFDCDSNIVTIAELNGKVYFFTLDGQLLDLATKQPLSQEQVQKLFQQQQQIAEMVNRLVRNYRIY